MNVDESTPKEEEYSLLFAAREAALQEDTDETLVQSTAPPDLAPRLERDLACVRLLRNVLRPSTRGHSPGELPWSNLGRFQLRRELGSGGFGIVYLAWDPLLNRAVALKVPRAEVAITPELRARFHNEARAAASLEHPNVVPIFEVGEVGPVCFLVSAYCPGPSLAEWLKRREAPMPFPDAAGLVATLAEAVHHAHGRGIAHRDLKPANVLLVSGESVSGESSTHHAPHTTHQPKITDFGLAKFFGEGVGGGATRTGAILGTPCYMAPEQAGGKVRDIGPATDTYALGAILYELMTGRPPFFGETDLDTLLQVQTDEPVPPSRLRPKTPRDLETICLKCLEKVPARRYASAQAMAEDLHRFLDGRPVVARPVGAGEKLWRWCRRKPLLAGLSAALLVVIASSLVALTLLWRQADDQRGQAEHNAQKYNTERQRAEDNLDQAWRAVRDHFIQLSDVEADDARDPKERRKQQLETAQRYFQEFLTQRKDDPKLRLEVADAHFRLGRITREIGAAADALAELERAAALLEDLRLANPADAECRAALASARIEIGVLHDTRSDLATAQRQYDEAKTLLEALSAEQPDVARFEHDLAAVWHNLGNLHLARQDVAAAVTAFQRASELEERLLERYPDRLDYQGSLALTRHNLGNVHGKSGKKMEARACYEEALALQEKVLERVPALARAQSRLATTAHSLGVLLAWQFHDPSAALPHYRRARALQEKLVQTHPATTEYQVELANTCHNLGTLERFEKNLAGAALFFEQARVLRERLATAHPTVPQYQLNLSQTYAELGGAERANGNFAAALRNFEQARAILRQLVQANPDNVEYRSWLGGTINNLALVLQRMDRNEEGLAAVDEAIEHQRVAHGQAPHVQQYRLFLGIHYYLRARLLRDLGRVVEAIQMLEAAPELWAESPVTLFDVAREYAHHATLVGQGKTELTPAEQADRQKYADRAMAFLNQAVASGYKNLAELRTHADLDPLRDRQDFKDLVARLEAKANATPQKMP